MKTIILGAGASHSHSSSPTGTRPPLAKSFFEAYNQLSISEDRYVLIGFIVNYVRDTRGVDPFQFGSWSENIEDFLTEIDDKIGTPQKALSLSLEDRILCSNAYNQMVFLFASVLNEIQNGPTSAVYLSFLNSLHSDDVIVTFNWDTLLDRVLYDSGSWNPQDGYGANFQGFFVNGWQPPRHRIEPSKWRLLKLHGSTNWLIPYRVLNLETGERVFINHSVDTSSRPLYCFVKADHPYSTYLNRGKSGYKPFSYYYYPPDIPIASENRTNGHISVAVVSAYDLPEHGSTVIGGFPYSSMPFIVAPVRKKEYGLLPNVLDPLWEQAETSIIQSSEVFIVGYSFPLTDTRPWQLFTNAISKRSNPLPITIVDPYPDQLLGRINSSFGSTCPVKIHRCTFDEFLMQ
jgi:hypothetical protein